MKPSDLEPPAVTRDKEPSQRERILKDVECLFLESQRCLRRFNKAGQEQFKVALLATLTEKLVPKKPLTGVQAMQHLKRHIQKHILHALEERETKS